MGYSHYWYRRRTIASSRYQAIVEDLSRLLPELKRQDVPLAGAFGTGRPRIDRQEIVFNGRTRCRHPQSVAPSAFSRMMALASLLSMPESEREAATRAMWEEEHARRRCPGTCAYETFWFPRTASDVMADDAGRYWDRTKTALRPYDIAVTASLIIARRHLGDDIRIASDGGQAQWFDARLLCQSVLGYGLTLPLGLHDE
ncbi:MAG: hypothetical protein EB084_07105 [Proteobacteria bacterium]|nr:hypothetical protein [Pseudomonadota bacterium]